ncbi:MAG: hypothetical protein ACUVTB_06220 [Candidatus Bathycorpusculaceae bacterium]
MRIRIPSKRTCEKFLLIYELEGAQKAVNYLTRYYEVRRMKIVVDGKRVMRTRTHKTYLAHYYGNKAYFTRRGLTKRNVLHELYHIAEAYGIEVRDEEKLANKFAKEILNKVRTYRLYLSMPRSLLLKEKR